jgi:2,5-diketo-D-gluconate reductase A
VLIQWHIRLGTIVIPKSADPTRMASNFDVFDFELNSDMSSISTGRSRLGPDARTFNFTGR